MCMCGCICVVENKILNLYLLVFVYSSVCSVLELMYLKEDERGCVQEALPLYKMISHFV